MGNNVLFQMATENTNHPLVTNIYFWKTSELLRWSVAHNIPGDISKHDILIR